jgi:spore maturation protein SpmA
MLLYFAGMALSRFWTSMVVLSIAYVMIMLGAGQRNSLGDLVNGKQGEPLVVWKKDSTELRGSGILEAVRSSAEGSVVQGDTLYQLANGGALRASAGRRAADGLFPTCRNTLTDLWLPLIGYLTFFCGLLNLLVDAKATDRLARLLSPLLKRIFPDLAKDHPAYGFMTLNFAANFLGLDSAATPFGLKAMESMQADNPAKDRATNGQIMFLCLHAAGLTLLPTSIIGYRAAQGAANPADIMIPCIVTSFVGTLAALAFVSYRQRISLLHWPVVLMVTIASAIMAGLMVYIASLSGAEKFQFTDNLGNGLLLLIIGLIVGYAFLRERRFSAAGTTVFDSFIHGAKEGFQTGLRVLPYMIAMLAALSIFRNSGLMHWVMGGLAGALGWVGVDQQVIDAIPVALMRPFSAGGSRGFMIDAMKTYGADSLAGRLACLFQGAAETTFYVVALYFGSVGVKNSRYTLGVMLLVDLVCVLTAVAVCTIYFA